MIKLGKFLWCICKMHVQDNVFMMKCTLIDNCSYIENKLWLVSHLLFAFDTLPQAFHVFGCSSSPCRSKKFHLCAAADCGTGIFVGCYRMSQILTAYTQKQNHSTVPIFQKWSSNIIQLFNYGHVIETYLSCHVYTCLGNK